MHFLQLLAAVEPNALAWKQRRKRGAAEGRPKAILCAFFTNILSTHQPTQKELSEGRLAVERSRFFLKIPSRDPHFLFFAPYRAREGLDFSLFDDVIELHEPRPVGWAAQRGGVEVLPRRVGRHDRGKHGIQVAGTPRRRA